MFHRLNTATGSFANAKVRQSVSSAVTARDTIKGFLTAMHHTLMLLGIAAIAAWAALFFKPDLADHLKAWSPFAETTAMSDASAGTSTPAHAMDTPSDVFAAVPATISMPISNLTQDVKNSPATPEQQRVTAWLSKRYRVATDATDMLVSATYSTAREINLDPLLILAVMAIESRFNPFAESPVGAQGLMQVMSKLHHDKFRDLGGIKAALNPAANIKVGSQILKEYVRRGGSIEAGLKMYVGAAAFDSDFGYGSRVLAEYRRLKDVSVGKKVPIRVASATPAKPKPVASEVNTPVDNVVSNEALPANQVKQSEQQKEQIATL